MVLAGLATLPLSASAQAGDEHSLSFRHDEALKIALFSSPPLGTFEYTRPTVIEAERRVKRAEIGLSISSVAFLAGVVLGISAVMGEVSCLSELFSPEPCTTPGWKPVGITGVVLFVGGLAGTITSGRLLRRRKRDRDRLEQAHFGTPRRVQWDLAQSRLVF
jgi:hypothetical protein